jgi:hypothetical protein
MGQVLHGSATTTEAIRRAIQHSQESLRALEGLAAGRDAIDGMSSFSSMLLRTVPLRRRWLTGRDAWQRCLTEQPL